MNKRDTAIQWIKSYLIKGDSKQAMRVFIDNPISVDVYRQLYRDYFIGVEGGINK